MGFYRERIFPKLVDTACNTAVTRRHRDEVCQGLVGEVLEVGFGTGLNLSHLPASVTSVLAVDPMDRGRELAAGRMAAAGVPVRFVGTGGESIDLPDDSADSALSSWTLCTVEDPVAAVAEIRRVLRPGGSLHFVEHGRSPDERVHRWQRRLRPLQRRIACGCTLDRDIPAILAEGGLPPNRVETSYAEGNPRVLGWTFLGSSTAPSAA